MEEKDMKIKMMKGKQVHNENQRKVPAYDGKSSWSTYLQQFCAAPNANGMSDKEKAISLIISL